MTPSVVRSVLHVSMQAMPYLLDHCFVRQRPGWPEESDRRPVMPATTIVHYMLQAVEDADPARALVELSDLRLMRWLAAAPQVDVPVCVTAAPGPGDELTWDVRFGDYSAAVVRSAPGHPRPPDPWRQESEERRPPDTAGQMYERRLMFHGPAFQGVTELTAMGERHVRGVIITPDAPGSLLDCAGQILGYWIIRTFTNRTRVLPVHLDRLRLFGPFPKPGTPVHCHVRVVAVEDDFVEADIELSKGERVWAVLSGWRNRRFANHPETQAVENFPEHRALSRQQPGGWVALFERWGDLASRDLVMRNHLGVAERADYEACPPLARRHWLLSRIGIKDAVRLHLWRGDLAPIFPAEIRVSDGADGQPVAEGLYGRQLPPLAVAAAQCRELGVVLTRPARGAGRPRIAVIEAPAPGPADPTDAAVEQLASQVAAGTAAAGSGDAPQVTRSHRQDDGTLVLSIRSGPGQATVDVAVRTLRNPDDLPPRHYLVAWTPVARMP